jgi:adenosylhomocysteinase
MASIIKDAALAPEGRRKLDWARQHMPVLTLLHQEFSLTTPLRGKTVLCCLHLEAKTGYLLLTLQAAGAQVIACASNPLSTQDDVAAALAEAGVTVYAVHGESPKDYDRYLNLALDENPNAVIDDGADVFYAIHKLRPETAAAIIGGCEETTTGVARLKVMDREGVLRFPIVAVNDAYMKYLFDNRYGTGQSVWDGINRATNLIVAGKTVVVAGYGWCGKGVSMRAKALGAQVIVTEIDPIKANEALMDGFDVMPMLDAAAQGDIFITVTGNIDVIRQEHMLVMKDGAILSNAGHFDVEVSKKDLSALAGPPREVRQHIEAYQLPDGRRLYLLAEGRLVNLAAGDGHPAEVMDLSFSLQALSLLYVIEHAAELSQLNNRLVSVPENIDRQVARLKLQVSGVQIDTLSPEQTRYLSQWE